LLLRSGFETVIERKDIKLIEKIYIENGIKNQKLSTNQIIQELNERRNNKC
jgi:hypothetical protein